jgi:phage gpG-like protein
MIHVKVTKPKKKNRAKRLVTGLEIELGRIGKRIVKSTQKNLNNRLLQRRSGRLWASFNHKTFSLKDGAAVLIGSDVVYARIHNDGGMTGRNHAARMKKRSYFTKALTKNKKYIRRHLSGYIGKIIR